MKSDLLLAAPLRVGNKILKNRMVMPPMETRLSNQDGSATKEMCDYYAERARGGVAMIVVENTFVDDRVSRSSLVSSGLYNEHMVASKYRLAEAIRQNGAVAIIQLSHGGRQANAYATGKTPAAPSAIPSQSVQRMPYALTKEEILEIEDAFVQAARRAQAAGFDGVEIHGAHGYLISSFLSPYSNKREDEYGGSEENRGRFAREIVQKVRRQVGRDFIVGFRINGDDYIDGGLTIEQSSNFIRSIEDEIDYVNVSAAMYESMEMQIAPLYLPQNVIIHLAQQMKQAVRIPVIGVGSLNAQLGEAALRDGKADLIAFGRSLIADPQMPNKILAGKEEEIRPCCRGNEGCISLFFRGCPIRCEVNPRCGREAEYPTTPACEPKKVVVVGGGVAGMEAARLAAEKGHSVTLFEASEELGGHFVEGTCPSFKQEGREFLAWQKRMLAKSGADVRLNTQATPEMIADLHADAVIVAVGSHYAQPPIAGIEKAMLPDEALRSPEHVGDTVFVIGGGLIGCETALALAEQGKSITIIEMRDGLVIEDEGISQGVVRAQVRQRGITVHLNTQVHSIGNGVFASDTDGNEITVIADTVIAATGLTAKDDLAASFEGTAPRVYRIGDCVKGRKIFECTSEAWHAVYDLEK